MQNDVDRFEIDVLNCIVQATDQNLSPVQVVCDFETGLIDAIQVQFPDAKVGGCLFHFKQAIRRKMMKCRLSTSEIGIAMRPGVMLTVIPPEYVDRGVRWVKATIKSLCSEKRWQGFWRYF
ncbi:TPA: hypothetical protein N0F65_001963 [Lagenidium giganteum]|uniref:MULE transposase domain-containing protein n=1 Tax=Lagenidium giganteum TaxID=4803 RepID=A0AAV2YQ78_9STRA|nr:TPA: hypothetical protein N0F65_001963 [Lagenidium giganteum]